MVVFLVSIKVSTEPDFYRTLGSYWTHHNKVITRSDLQHVTDTFTANFAGS